MLYGKYISSIYKKMGRKPKQYKYVKETDGRRNNGRKKGVRNVPVVRPTSSAAPLTMPSETRVGIYALNAMAKVFGSEEEAWESLASKPRILSHILNYYLNINMVSHLINQKRNNRR